MIDIVIPLGNGSKWQDNELRYCLRSIEKHLTGYRNIWIIGFLPKWVTEINYLPTADQTQNSDYNIALKVEIACYNAEISDSFLFMNDDHYLLYDYLAPNFPYYHSGTLEAMAQLRGRSPYGKKCLNTAKVCNQTKYFDIHTPIIYQKEQFLKHVTEKDWGKRQDSGYVIKSLYANSLLIQGEPMTDCKSSKIPLPSWKIFSSTPVIKQEVKDFLQDTFPNKSKYEV